MSEKIAEEWLEKAKSDLSVARILTEHDGPRDAICFHAQQAVEKLFKCYLAGRGQKPPRTHDLAWLCRLASNHHSDFKRDLDDCRWLTQFYIESRYPVGGDTEYTPEVVERCLEIAERIADRVQEYFGGN